MKLSTTNYQLPTQKGFTLIELLVSIFIVVVISTVTLINYRQGETRRRVALASDTVINLIRTAQNNTLTGKAITQSSCANQAPKSYLVFFSSAQAGSLYGQDNCDDLYLIENLKLPERTVIEAGSYQLNGSGVSALQINFSTPFATMTASTTNQAGAGTFSAFNAAALVVTDSSGSIPKIISVDGVSGRIGE